ncbi:MAG: hypothetical protein ABJN40_13505 [Sneathiella sp.]
MKTGILVSVIIMGCAALPVAAQIKCFERDKVTSHLDEAFAEASIAAGMTEDGSLLEVFSDIHGKTWTILISTTSGLACIMASGHDWNRLKALEKKAEQKQPSEDL